MEDETIYYQLLNKNDFGLRMHMYITINNLTIPFNYYDIHSM